jgi:hypothetical protein
MADRAQQTRPPEAAAEPEESEETESLLPAELEETA